MNNKRRKYLSMIIEKVNVVSDILDDVISEENEAYDNLPESIQSGDKGERMEEIIGLLDKARECFDEVVDLLNEASE